MEAIVSEQNLETKMAVHEAICAERYGRIDVRMQEGDRRMTKIEYLLYALIIAVLFGPGVAADFVKKLLNL
jgi:hypothetical protein